MKFQFLKKCAAVFFATVMMTATLPTMVIATENSNLISNSTFDSGTSGWGTYSQSDAKCSLGTDNNRLSLNILSTGTETWSVQMFYDIVPLYKNGVYRVKYDISSTTNRTVDGMLQQNGGDYQAYTSKRLSLTSEMQTVNYEFTMKSDTDIMARLEPVFIGDLRV